MHTLEDTDEERNAGAPSAGEHPDEIARRAYERYQARGGEHGHDQEDWFEAEREIRGRRE